MELLDDLLISSIFNVSDLYDFHEFDGEIGPAMDKDWIAQLPKKKTNMAEEMLDVKEVRSGRRNLYCRCVKWLDKLSIESTLIFEEELKSINPSAYQLFDQASHQNQLFSLIISELFYEFKLCYTWFKPAF